MKPKIQFFQSISSTPSSQTSQALQANAHQTRLARWGISLLILALIASAFISLTFTSQRSLAQTTHTQNERAAGQVPQQVGQAGPNLAPDAPQISYSFTPVITQGIDSPVFVTHAGDNRLFIIEQDGRIRIWENNALRATPFLSIEPLVLFDGEQGLLGLAFEPNYAQTGRFYVYYTNNAGDENIARYTRSITDTNLADPLSATLLLTITHPNETNHNGGWLGFGPDGFLYAGTGDGGGGGDPQCTAQNLNELRGKMLRLNVVGAITYTTPISNMANARPEVWAIGLRNPWRNSFDRLTGDFYIADVGQGAWEEVNAAPAGSAAGLNFGWSQREGRHDYNNNCPPSGIPQTEPFFDYGHNAAGGRSVTGGYVYRGPSYPWLNGFYFFGDFGSGRIWASSQPTTTGVYSTVEILDTNYGISSFGEDASGELYLINYGAGDILRLQSTLDGPTPTPTHTATPSRTPTSTTTAGPMEPRGYLPVVMANYLPVAPEATTTPTSTATATATATTTATTTSTSEPGEASATPTATATVGIITQTLSTATSTPTATLTPTSTDTVPTN